MKKLALVCAIALTAGLALVAAPASATCTTGEICFYKNDNGGGAVYETIARAQSHTNLRFSDGKAVRNNVDSVRNRDTSCSIKVVDDRGIYPDDWQSITNNGRIYNLISSVSNQNDRHERSSC